MLILSRGIRIYDTTIQLFRGYDRFELSTQIDHSEYPGLRINESADRLFGLFMDLLGFLGSENEEACVFLETSHPVTWKGSTEIAECDFIALQSNLWDFEDVLVHDGEMKISICLVRGEDEWCEIQLERGKYLVVYTSYNTRELVINRVEQIHELPYLEHLITTASIPYVPQTTPELELGFYQLCARLGVDTY
ncbi:MAG: hypothetical protein WEC84_04225 [Candidatus Andersenbacteria bacterium]